MSENSIEHILQIERNLVLIRLLNEKNAYKINKHNIFQIKFDNNFKFICLMFYEIAFTN